MQQLYQAILDLASRVVIPDWGELIKLIPLGLAGIVLLWLLLVARQYATVGPARRASARLTPITPPELHMPGPSYAPIVAAVGAAALLWGLVVGGDALLIGTVVLVLSLLYWGREAIHDYDRTAHVQTLPAVVHPGPPPGVHMPGPSFRPLLGALGTTALMAGLVAGGWLLAAGVIILILTLGGWLVDARAEYVKTEEADRTGHMENIADPRWPRRLLQFGAVLFVVALLLQAGILPPKGSSTAGGGPGTSAAPSGPAATPGTAFNVTAKDIAYDQKAFTVAAGADFTIAFTNADSPGVTHDVDIRATDKTTVLQNQEVTNGGSKTTYSYKGLPAGTYVFICSIHPIPQMTGTLTVK
ncbi:MAG: cupredoxin domain-containing protein [Chloroflexi bacterium]|nr:cupredoxin domain-containing protein [Chloroflexota bacterium]